MATVLVTVLGIAVTYMVAPSQEIATQEAVEQYQREQDAQNAPVVVEDIFGTSGPEGEANLISASVVDLDGEVLHETSEDPYGVSPLLPSPFPLGLPTDTGSKDTVGFTLTGKQNANARIRDIYAVITERNSAPRGTMIYWPPQGRVDNLQMGFDLDSDDLSARVLDGNLSITDRHYFRENTVSLARGEPLGFNTIAFTNECACKFVIAVEFSDGRTVEIDNNGQPFMLAPYRDDAERIYTPTNHTGEGWTLTRCASREACAQIAYK